MKNFRQDQKGWTKNSPDKPRRGNLLRHPGFLSYLLLALPGPALLFSAASCAGEPAQCAHPQTHVVADEDTLKGCNTTEKGIIRLDGDYVTTDIFLYREQDGLMESHIHGTATEFETILPQGSYTAILICNSPHAFDDNALQHQETMELIDYRLHDEDPENPVCSAATTYMAGDTACLHPERILCPVTLYEITNCLDGYRLLENPQIHLENINDGGEALRFSGFRPRASHISSDTLCLDHDIGMFTQYPSKTLYCYPDDGRDCNGADGQMFFVLNCTVRGKLLEFRCPLEPMPRNTSRSLSASIISESECEWSIQSAH